MAGEEALKSSASDEALHYYQDALRLYLEKHGEKASSEKVAALEKSIALALYNRGQYEEAVEHFEKALTHYWRRPIKSTIMVALEAFSSFAHFLVAVYLPSLKFKHTPTERDKENLTLFHKKCSALATIDPRRFLLDSLSLYRHLTRFHLSQFDLGTEIFVASSSLFSYTGISFKLSRKILDSTWVKAGQDKVKPATLYDLLNTAHNYFAGHWHAIEGYRIDRVERDLSRGYVYYASQYSYWHGVSALYRGSLGKARSIVEKLSDIVDVYDHDFSKLAKYRLNTTLLIETRELRDALVELEVAIRFAQKAKFPLSLIDLYACKALVHVFMDGIEDAQVCLNHADEIRSTVNAAPVQLSNYHRSHVYCDLYRLKQATLERNEPHYFTCRDKALRSVKSLSRISKRVAQHRTESFTLLGVYHWLIGKQRRAIDCWQESIKEGKRLSANLELSRSYFEVARHLDGPTSKHKNLNGSSATEHLEKARGLFEKMKLSWDLEELGRHEESRKPSPSTIDPV